MAFDFYLQLLQPPMNHSTSSGHQFEHPLFYGHYGECEKELHRAGKEATTKIPIRLTASYEVMSGWINRQPLCPAAI